VSDPDPFQANLQRGSLLLDQNRPAEALPFLQAAIAANPHAPQGYAELARCWNALPATRAKSIAAIDRAIALAPTTSFYFGRKGWYLICLMRFRAALACAQQGLALNPTCPQSLNAQANAYTKLGQWKNAEKACRRILELDPNDDPGLNLLAQALRYQGRWKESREVVDRLLARLPNNAFGHANAGYAALAAGDHLRANEHFLESLRMEPHSDLARRGLLESLRARIWIIRFNRYLFRAGSLRNLIWTAAILLGIVGTGYLGDFLNSIYPKAGAYFAGIAIGLFLLYVYLSLLVGVMGTFLLLFDPIGRHALTPREKVKACLPIFLAAAAVAALLCAGQWPIALAIVAGLLVLAVSIHGPALKDRRERRRQAESGG
jgi:tetratricopeptide (TPR) repeat protein